MGLLDIPGVALSWGDALIAGILPDVARLALWSVLAGIACMLLYARISRQDKLESLKYEAREARAKLASYDGDFDGVLAIARDNLRLSLQRLRLSLIPAMWASLPLLFVAVWMSGAFAYRAPADGERIQVAVIAEAENGGGEAVPARRWNVVWSEGEGAPINGPGGIQLGELTPNHLSGIVHPRRWWNLLIGNPAGYLPDESTIREVKIGLQPARYIAGVPGWMAGWEFLFIVIATAASLTTKTVLRLN